MLRYAESNGSMQPGEPEKKHMLKNLDKGNNNNNYYYYYLLQLGCHPVAVVILHVYKI